MARPTGLTKEQLMGLIGAGGQHREDQKKAAMAPAPEPPPAPVAAERPAPKPAKASAAPASVQAPSPEPERRPPAKATQSQPAGSGEGEEEPPAERPERFDETPKLGLPRARRVGLRSDPAWQMKTLYLRKATIAATEEIARSMGVEFSEFVEYALALQAQPETRSASLAALLASREVRG